jgi:hypothetical protein
MEPRVVEERGVGLCRYVEGAANEATVWGARARDGACPVREFFELSALSFHRVYGAKRKEGWVRKLSGGRSDAKVIRTWRRRWAVVRDTFVAYFKAPSDLVPQDVLLVDSAFRVLLVNEYELVVENTSRKLALMFPSSEQVRFCCSLW